ncbi:hypothetical protein MSG28_000361 [Choristoneura fumiferana]|uniref:Uncharacterized protein n=1 Tax=Choristoneura fumiferana TaxID=7141 RepID=A0ACC0K0A6_CHOFU|nr:hypothetical protein MSG28_000361 [Choristoneura fumiferana]
MENGALKYGSNNNNNEIAEEKVWGPHVIAIAGRLSSAAFAVWKIRQLTDVATARQASQAAGTQLQQSRASARLLDARVL